MGLGLLHADEGIECTEPGCSAVMWKFCPDMQHAGTDRHVGVLTGPEESDRARNGPYRDRAVASQQCLCSLPSSRNMLWFTYGGVLLLERSSI